MTSTTDLLARAAKPGEIARDWHQHYHGKIQMTAKCAVRDVHDFSVWYTPGVAEPCRAIHANPALSYEYTNRANTIAIVSDGTRVLGLGDIGPQAAMPVMEGKALLFKYLGGVDAVPLCLNAPRPEDLIHAVKCLEPSFGGINLEDISQPKCFDVLDQLRSEMGIPVWHDDQQGSATVALAGLINALKVVDKPLSRVRIAMIGVGAANVATYRLLSACGADLGRIVACDRTGILHRQRLDIEQRSAELRDKWRICLESNAEGRTGGIPEALEGADVCIAFSGSGPGTIHPDWISKMASQAIVFACANPVPEIWPWEAKQAGALVVATGRSDFPNQVNNSLGFPGIFRGTLDVRARTITDEMAMAAAFELARAAEESRISPDRILPGMDEWQVVPRIAAAVAVTAQQQKVARLSKPTEQVLQESRRIIEEARSATSLLMREGLIAPVPRDNP